MATVQTRPTPSGLTTLLGKVLSPSGCQRAHTLRRTLASAIVIVLEMGVRPLSPNSGHSPYQLNSPDEPNRI